MPVTIHELAVEVHKRRGDDIPDHEFSGHFYFDAGYNMLGGCELCGATLAAYNAHPSRSGWWRCGDCIGDDGYGDIDSAYRHVHLGEPHPEPPVRYEPQDGRWEIPGGHVGIHPFTSGVVGPRHLSLPTWLMLFGMMTLTGHYHKAHSKGHENRKGGPPVTRWSKDYGHYVR